MKNCKDIISVDINPERNGKNVLLTCLLSLRCTELVSKFLTTSQHLLKNWRYTSAGEVAGKWNTYHTDTTQNHLELTPKFTKYLKNHMVHHDAWEFIEVLSCPQYFFKHIFLNFKTKMPCSDHEGLEVDHGLVLAVEPVANCCICRVLWGWKCITPVLCKTCKAMLRHLDLRWCWYCRHPCLYRNGGALPCKSNRLPFSHVTMIFV